MIVLKILLWIILSLIGFTVVICILPVGGEFSYIDGKLKFKVKVWVLKIIDSDRRGILGWILKLKAKQKPKKPKPVKAKKKKTKPTAAEEKPPEEDKPLENSPMLPDVIQEAEEVPAEELSAEELAAIEELTADEELLATDGGGKKKKEKKKKKKKKEAEETYYEFGGEDDEESDEDEPKKSLEDKIGFIIGIVKSAGRPMRTILRGVKFSDVYIDFIIADEDAAQCAIRYGMFNAVIFNLLSFYSHFFTVRLKTVDIRPGFGVANSQMDAAGKLRFRLGTTVIAGMLFLITFIFKVFIPGKLKARKARKLKKAAASQK